MNNAAKKTENAVMSLELALTIGLPLMSIVIGSVMAFVAYTRGFTEIAHAPAAIVAHH